MNLSIAETLKEFAKKDKLPWVLPCEMLKITPCFDALANIDLDGMLPVGTWLKTEFVNCDDKTIWLVYTSGTTGKPKVVNRSLETLTKDTNPKPSNLKWGLLYHYATFAGLQVILHAFFSKATLIIPNREWPIVKKLNFLSHHKCTALSATPALWRQILMANVIMPLEQITLGGEIADQAILDALRNKHPEARITHIYASTEAGVCFSVKDGRAGFPARVMTDDRFSVADGELIINDCQTGDIVERIGDRYYFSGRRDNMAIIGGRNIHMEQVEIMLAAKDGVEMVRCRVENSSILGQVIIAEVIGNNIQFDDISLPIYAEHVSNFPLTESGKIKR